MLGELLRFQKVSLALAEARCSAESVPPRDTRTGELQEQLGCVAADWRVEEDITGRGIADVAKIT